ncbi:DUF3823 domain-containing protein [Persicobacter psychrovividus]|uniref:DUF3823 domain-containing protein n=1 Tax=Persicobacter psychrovividus TaxID=387638 RepID=A0ABM7VM77_9BACT|nr:hypothetical protein PEPS_42980 [Persicobacter psychrovividus]
MRNLVIFLLAALVLSSCIKEDNFPQPNATFYGKIIDVDTGEPIITSRQGAGVVRLIEISEKYPDNTSPQDLNIGGVGSGAFRNSMIFNGTYKATLHNGPFKYLGDTIEVTLNGDTEHNFEVLPNMRISVELDGATGIKYVVNRPEGIDGDLQSIAVLFNTWETVDLGTSNQVLGNAEFINAHSGMLDREFSYDFGNKFEDGKDYYIRVAASMYGQWNYSQIFHIAR